MLPTRDESLALSSDLALYWHTQEWKPSSFCYWYIIHITGSLDLGHLQ